MKFVFTFFLLIYFSLPATSLADAMHPIDKLYSDCLAKKENMTTAGMTNCTTQAIQKWDEQVSVIYKQLQAHLSPEAKVALISSQESWLIYREHEFKAISSIYEYVQGTMYISMRAMNMLLINKNRAIALNSYANAIGI